MQGKGGDLAFAREKSECVERQCCGPNRSFTLSVDPMTGGVRQAAPEHSAVTADRPFKCTFLCFQRPVIHIKVGGLHVARVFSPFSCCSTIMQILPPDAAEVGEANIHPSMKEHLKSRTVDETVPFYTLEASCCQIVCPCGPCKRYVFDITDESGAKVGEMAKIWSGCFKECIGDSDNFTLEFPEGCPPVLKVAMTVSVVLADMLLFEDKDNNK